MGFLAVAWPWRRRFLARSGPTWSAGFAKGRRPHTPELALGAVTADGARFMNQALARELGVSQWMFRVLADEQRAEARHREQRLRGRRPAPHLAGRTVILVDDGLATGATTRAAIRSVRQAGPARLVVAVPGGRPADVQGAACRG